MTSYRPGEHTKLCISSVLETAVQPYSLTIVSTGASAAINKNLAINMCRSKDMILIDDDIIFTTKAWNKVLITSLQDNPSAAVVGCKIIDLNGFLTMSYKAPPNSVVDGVRVVGAVMAIRKTKIRYDEKYIESQCDDLDFFMQNQVAGYSVLCDTRVMATHLKPNTTPIPDTHPNVVRVYGKWGKKAYNDWGRDPSKYRVLRRF